MRAMLDDLEAQALKLTAQDRSELVHRLLMSLEGGPCGTPDEIAQAWDEEIARRVAEIDAGTADLIPSEQVFAEVESMLEQARQLVRN